MANTIKLTTLKNPVHLLALGFGTGCSSRMPGTIGTLVGVVFYLLLLNFHLSIYIFVTSVLFLAGIWICGKTSSDLGVEDHPAIVWDEIVGYLVTMTAVPEGWVWAIAGFLLFRFFDITKPWPVNWADRQVKGGLGIMLDDLIAAFFALMVLQIIAGLL